MIKNKQIKYATIALIMSALGAFFKIYGGTKYGSEAVFVDGLTCVAGLFAGLSVIWWLRKALRPPDEDHPYGHERLMFGGIIYTIMIYSLIAGYVLFMLLRPKSHEVSSKASIFATIGVGFYALAIIFYRKVKVAGSPIAVFTFSEILEGIVSIGASLLGSMLGYVIDYVGAWIIEIYLFFEIGEQSFKFVNMISDKASSEIKEHIESEIKKKGFRILSLRIRCVVPGKYHGDVVVIPPDNVDYSSANMVMNELVRSLLKENIDLVVRIEHNKN